MLCYYIYGIIFKNVFFCSYYLFNKHYHSLYSTLLNLLQYITNPDKQRRTVSFLVTSKLFWAFHALLWRFEGPKSLHFIQDNDMTHTHTHKRSSTKSLHTFWKHRRLTICKAIWIALQVFSVLIKILKLSFLRFLSLSSFSGCRGLGKGILGDKTVGHHLSAPSVPFAWSRIALGVSTVHVLGRISPRVE